MSSFGSINVAAGAAAQTFTTTPAKVTAFTANGAKSSVDTGGDQSVTPDVANDRLRLMPGVYEVSFCGSFGVAVAQNFTFQAYTKVGAAAAVAVAQLAGELTGTAGATKVATAFSGILNLAGVAPDPASGFIDLELWGVSNLAGGAAITMEYGQFMARRLDV